MYCGPTQKLHQLMYLQTTTLTTTTVSPSTISTTLHGLETTAKTSTENSDQSNDTGKYIIFLLL